jgi:putative ABC transport system ATP-binding protein
MDAVETRELTKVYGAGEVAVTALDHVSLRVRRGEFVAVMGPSGCGKSTLLQLVGGLDRPTSGDVLVAGQSLARLGDDSLTALRRRKIGFVFQSFNLIPVLNAVENVALPLVLDGVRPSEAQRRAAEQLRTLGLADRASHRPAQLSGGQQQRVAIARALVTEPALVLADEPTGNLDSRVAAEIAALLRRSSAEWGRTVLMVTHDPAIAAYAGRVITMRDAAVVGDDPGDTRPSADVLGSAAEVAR